MLFGCACDAEGENRAYILTNKDQLSRFLPSAVTRDKKSPLLMNWDFLKLLPAACYVLVFPLRTQSRFQALLSEATYVLDSYPSPSSKADDPERISGFVNREALRLLLYPDALRFFWAGLHEPLLAEGAWPSARAVMQSGFVLRPGVRNALAAKLATVAASAARLHHMVRERHWPTQELATDASLEADERYEATTRALERLNGATELNAVTQVNPRLAEIRRDHASRDPLWELSAQCSAFCN